MEKKVFAFIELFSSREACRGFHLTSPDFVIYYVVVMCRI
jgi:hypothetical protein